LRAGADWFTVIIPDGSTQAFLDRLHSLGSREPERYTFIEKSHWLAEQGENN